MKKVLFFLSVLTLFLPSVIGQTNMYHPFPDSNAVWSEWHEPSMSSGQHSYNYRYILPNKDTTINTKNYHQLFYSTIDSSYSNYLNSDYYGSIREENKKVLFVPKDSLNEYVVYDFSVDIGDTIYYTYCSVVQNSGVFSMFYYLVADIDSVLIYDGSYRKRISITDIYGTASDLYAQWIEGIGSTNGLLFPLGLFPMNGSNNILGCLSQNDAIIYFNNSGPFDRCYPSNASIDENIPLPLQNISPNPFTTSTQITLDKTYHHISLSLYDIQGKLMMEKEYADCNQIQLNRNGLNNGMYFIKLTLDYRWVETGKIVVSE